MDKDRKKYNDKGWMSKERSNKIYIGKIQVLNLKSIGDLICFKK